MKKLAVVIAIGVSAVACPPTGTNGPNTPPNITTDGGGPLCQLVEGVTQNQTLVSICATVEEIALIIATVGPFLRVTGDAGAEPCTPIPTSTACASPKNIGRGISAVVAQRQARLRSDAGGAP